ncbi:dethiobiotin synthase [Vibrio sp. CK2-1]|uniref:dethiobiotin synthase n=1 Tax=Vibrio sp. CK2-1 TaxID=2912249 RepID=UPI001EFF8590|nr:dethiobiotin synthase [Vibrio sp. CK2-1]MCF7354541.1 dethiobiotin synthase [Vibrio sp. CK2-1]
MSHCVFITGTDTEVGKTLVSQALIKAFAQRDYQVSGFKPIAAGCEVSEQGLVNEDALALQKASNVELSYAEVNPFALLLPTSPHIAAKRESVIIDFKLLDKSLDQHKVKSDIVVVEGAGGWKVPVSDSEFLSTWVKQQKLPIIIVVGIRLGCLNHALLTFESIRNDGLEVVGWVANRVDPDFGCYDENVAFLERHIAAPKLAEIPYLSALEMMDVEQYIDLGLLKFD